MQPLLSSWSQHPLHPLSIGGLSCRVMEALADVSQQRRKLEAAASSIAAKSAAASARLAQDSRDAAAALMEELRARREATQQGQQAWTHGGGAVEAINNAEGRSIRKAFPGPT